MRRKASYQGYVSKYYTVRPLGLLAYDMGLPVHEVQDMMERARMRRFKEDGGPMVMGDQMRKTIARQRG